MFHLIKLLDLSMSNLYVKYYSIFRLWHTIWQEKKNIHDPTIALYWPIKNSIFQLRKRVESRIKTTG